MSDRYSLSDSQRRACRWFSLLFCAAAIGIGAVAALALSTPGGLTNKVRCVDLHCQVVRETVDLLPQAVRAKVEATPGLRAGLETNLAQARTRAVLTAIELVRCLPLAALFALVAMAMRRLGASGADGYAKAMPWLRRAALAAVVAALAVPVADTLRATVLVDAIDRGRGVYVMFNASQFVGDLLLAAAAWASIWALAAGSRARRDIAEIV